MSQRVKCINGTFNHRFEAFVDEKMNVKEQCMDCNHSHIYMVADSYNKIINNKQKNE